MSQYFLVSLSASPLLLDGGSIAACAVIIVNIGHYDFGDKSIGNQVSQGVQRVQRQGIFGRRLQYHGHDHWKGAAGCRRKDSEVIWRDFLPPTRQHVIRNASFVTLVHQASFFTSARTCEIQRYCSAGEHQNFTALMRCPTL